MSLEKLSPEVLQLILRFAHPSAHFSFALTSKTLYENSLNILERHRAADQKYAITSDIKPLNTIPDLLRSAYGSGADGIEAWHVRELEIWQDRSLWEEWTECDISTDGKISYQRDSSITSPFSLGEQRKILYNSPWGEALFLEGNEELFASAQREIRSGRDGFLKMLLIAGLPRLETLKFVKDGKERPASFIWLSKAMRQSIKTGIWPPGLQSLRKVYAGIAVDPESEGLAVPRGGIELARLLRLPNIEEIYFCDLDMVFPEYFDPELYERDPSHPEAGTKYDKMDYDDYWEMEEILAQRKTSTVKKLILDRVASFDNDAREIILGAPKSLESFVVRGIKNFRPTYDHPHTRFNQFLTIVTALSKHQNRSLRDLVVYEKEHIDGDPRHHLYSPPELKNFNHLQIVSVCLEDMIPTPTWTPNTTWSREVSLNRNDPNYPSLVQKFIEAFPTSISALAFCSTQASVSYTANKLDYLEDGLIAMIKSGTYTSLTDIYIDDLELHSLEPRTAVAFRKAIRVGLERGVKIHTLTNTQLSNHKQPVFPVMPDKYYLETGPFEFRSPKQVFNPLSGSWVKRSCHGCGACQACTRAYTQDAWTNFKAAEARSYD